MLTKAPAIEGHILPGGALLLSLLLEFIALNVDQLFLPSLLLFIALAAYRALLGSTWEWVSGAW